MKEQQLNATKRFHKPTLICSKEVNHSHTHTDSDMSTSCRQVQNMMYVSRGVVVSPSQSASADLQAHFLHFFVLLLHFFANNKSSMLLLFPNFSSTQDTKEFSNEPTAKPDLPRGEVYALIRTCIYVIHVHVIGSKQLQCNSLSVLNKRRRNEQYNHIRECY